MKASIIYLYLCILVSSSCVSINEELTDPEVSPSSNVLSYQIDCFPDYMETGIYALDPRPLYKHTLYRFDIASNSWSAIGDRVGLSKTDRYNLIFKTGNDWLMPRWNNNSPHAIDRDLILHIDDNNAYEFNKVLKYWKSIHLNGIDEYGKAIFFNSFNHTYYAAFDSSLYVLKDDYSFKFISKIPDISYDKVVGCEFIGKDSFAIVNRKLNNDYYSSDYGNLTYWEINVINIKTQQFKCIHDSLLNEIDPTNIYLNKLKEGKILTIYSTAYPFSGKKLIGIDLKTEQKIKYPEFHEDSYLYDNPFNRKEWAEVKYAQQETFYNLFYIHNDIYLFYNEKGFVLHENGEEWEALPMLEFDTLNAL